MAFSFETDSYVAADIACTRSCILTTSVIVIVDDVVDVILLIVLFFDGSNAVCAFRFRSVRRTFLPTDSCIYIDVPLIIIIISRRRRVRRLISIKIHFVICPPIIVSPPVTVG